MKRLAALLALALCACAFVPLDMERRDPVLLASRDAADRLVSQWKPAAPNEPILVATVVDVDDLKRSSTLGRILAEQVGSSLAQRGYGVVEMKLRESLYVSASQGELLLSREARDIAERHRAHAFVLGTYATSDALVYVTLKVVSAVDSRVLAATDYALAASEVRGMLPPKPRPNAR